MAVEGNRVSTTPRAARFFLRVLENPTASAFMRADAGRMRRGTCVPSIADLMRCDVSFDWAAVKPFLRLAMQRPR